MHRHLTAGVATVATLLATAIGLPAAATAAPRYNPTASRPAVETDTPARSQRGDNLPSARADQQTKLRRAAIAQLLQGHAKLQNRNGSQVIQLGKDFVEYKRKPKTDPIFTILAQFGTKTRSDTGGSAGPRHNQIPKPDRVYDGSATDDNTTIWQRDFSRQSYQEMLFSKSSRKESMSDFYLRQSSGRYTVTGHVTDWVTLPYNEARYGSNSIDESDGYWNFIKDATKAWYDAQRKAGRTNAQIKAFLTKFDVWDRNDYDGDGDFNEPDGYIDHLQVIHAGDGEESGGGPQGDDAIWSHRWEAFPDLEGVAGPSFNLDGGVPFGNSGIWARDYTTEPENGGLAVFCHEYGHDLGLPDFYDTAGGDNGTGFWTLMSSGSWLGHGKQDIGGTPGFMGPEEKLFLGWLNFTTVASHSGTKVASLGSAADGDGPLAQAVVVTLPDQTVTTSYNTPYQGSYEWWGGSADDLDTTLSRDLDLTGATSAALTAKAWYDTEEGYDYFYGEVTADGGATWTKLPTAGIDPGETGLDGSSGGWVDLSYDLSAYVGKTARFRFHYVSDGGVHGAGPFLDAISLVTNAGTVWTDDAETDTGAWTASGWARTTGTETNTYARYYIAENRSYVSYDATLRTGPYNWGFPDRPQFVEHFPYQDGLLVWYVNHAYEDNNTSAHPGAGYAMVVDARPQPIVVNGVTLGNTRQAFDATFGMQKTDKVTFHKNGGKLVVPARPGITVFDDTNPEAYWSADNPENSVKVAGTGTKIRVVYESHGKVDVMVVKIGS